MHIDNNSPAIYNAAPTQPARSDSPTVVARTREAAHQVFSRTLRLPLQPTAPDPGDARALKMQGASPHIASPSELVNVTAELKKAKTTEQKLNILAKSYTSILESLSSGDKSELNKLYETFTEATRSGKEIIKDAVEVCKDFNYRFKENQHEGLDNPEHGVIIEAMHKIFLAEAKCAEALDKPVPHTESNAKAIQTAMTNWQTITNAKLVLEQRKAAALASLKEVAGPPPPPKDHSKIRAELEAKLSKPPSLPSAKAEQEESLSNILKSKPKRAGIRPPTRK